MTLRSIRIALAPGLLVALGAACVQPPDPAPAAAAPPTQATAAPSSAVARNPGMRDTIGVPTEPFAGGEKAVATVKKKLSKSLAKKKVAAKTTAALKPKDTSKSK